MTEILYNKHRGCVMLMRLIKCYGKKLILKELKSSYKFFIKEANTNKNSIGYGLIRDKTILANDVASIASVGYGLGALIIGVEHKWIDYRKAYERIEKTLDTFINYVEGKNGFYYHFVNIQNGKREWNCEISIIDTAIFICGAIGSIVFTPKESISAMEYIGIDKEIEVIMIENYLNGTIWCNI